VHHTEQGRPLVEFTSPERGIDSIAENGEDEYSSDDDQDQYSRTGSEKGIEHGIQSSSPNEVQDNLSVHAIEQRKDVTDESKYPSNSPGYLHPNNNSRPIMPHYYPPQVSSSKPSSGANGSQGIPRSYTANDIMLTPAELPVDMISPQLIETPPNTPATPFASPSVNMRNPRGTSEPYRVPTEKLVVGMK